MLRVAEVLGAVGGFFTSPQKVAKDNSAVGVLVEGFLTLVLIVPSEAAAVCSKTIPWEVVRLCFPTNLRGLVELLLSTLLGVVRVFLSTVVLGEDKMFVSV